MHFHDWALTAIAFFSEILGTISGFGSSTFFVPIALLLERFQFVLALTAILHCFGNFFKILLFRRDFEWKPFLLLFLPSVLFTGVGAQMSAKFSNESMQSVLGVFLILLALFTLFGKNRAHRIPRWVAILLSSISGFSTGLIGTGGAIRGTALAFLNMPKNAFVAISSAIDIGGDLVRATIYISNGFMDWTQWFYLPMLFVAAFLGANVGRMLLARINQNHFEKLVSLFVLGSGILMICNP